MKIAVIGAGKMGRWFIEELSKDNETAVYDIVEGKAGNIRNAKSLESFEDLREFGPDMLLNAVTLQNTVDAFESSMEFLPEGCVLVDVASIKGPLPQFYAGCGFRFVSMHPMFGPTFATMDSLREENAIIISEGDAEIRGFFMQFFSTLGVRVFEYTFFDHDEMMAYSLTTPFVSSLVFAACVDRTAVPGSTFARHMKIARGLLSEDDYLLTEILFNAHSLTQLDRITSRLEFLKHVIRAKDSEEAFKFFERLRTNIEKNK